MDLPTFRYIDADTLVYLYYAGRDRKYMAISRAESVLFLDLPGLLVDEGTWEDDGKMVQALRRADAVKRFISDPINAPAPRPLNEYAADFPTVAGRVDRSFVADFSNLNLMFRELRTGDLVIMTPHSHYDPLLVGEVVGPWLASDVMTLPGSGENTLPYRKVRWLSHGLARNDFPVPVARRLQNRRAITTIDPELYEPIFRLVYRAYIWGNTSKIDIYAPNYNSSDPTANSEASFLIKYAIAFYAAFLAGRVEEFQSLDVVLAADQFFDPAIAIQVAQAFGSPGGYVGKLIAAGAIAVAGILAVALSDESQSISIVQADVANQIEAIPTKDRAQREHLRELGNALRAGNHSQIREQYGRVSKSKIGLTLNGERSPEVMVRNNQP